MKFPLHRKQLLCIFSHFQAFSIFFQCQEKEGERAKSIWRNGGEEIIKPTTFSGFFAWQNHLKNWKHYKILHLKYHTGRQKRSSLRKRFWSFCIIVYTHTYIYTYVYVRTSILITVFDFKDWIAKIHSIEPNQLCIFSYSYKNESNLLGVFSQNILKWRKTSTSH